MTNMRQLHSAFMLYRGEHNGYFPPGKFVPHEGDDKSNFNWQPYLIPTYLGKAPYCPSLRLTTLGKTEIANAKAHFEKRSGYSINYYFLRTLIQELPGKWWGSAPYPGAAHFVFLAETSSPGTTWSTEHPDYALNGYDVASVRLAPRNHGKEILNWCFLDGHIEPLARPLDAQGKPDWGRLFHPQGADGKYIGIRAIPYPLDHPGF